MTDIRDSYEQFDETNRSSVDMELAIIDWEVDGMLSIDYFPTYFDTDFLTKEENDTGNFGTGGTLAQFHGQNTQCYSAHALLDI